MTFVFSGYRFSFILHLAYHPASLSRSLCKHSAAKSIFLPLAGVICKLRLVSLVVTRIWHVIDIDKKSNVLKLNLVKSLLLGKLLEIRNLKF